MMGWLDRLKNETPPTLYATKPTKPPQGEEKAGFVGFVACPPASMQKIEGVEPLAVPQAVNDANDPANSSPATGLDRWNWPHSPAMNGVEMDGFLVRLVRFTDKGVGYGEAERLADGLVSRDREGDDRRLCLECTYLQGQGRWRCGNAAKADVASEALAPALVLMLQRCGGFGDVGALQNIRQPDQDDETNLPIDFGKSKPTE